MDMVTYGGQLKLMENMFIMLLDMVGSILWLYQLVLWLLPQRPVRDQFQDMAMIFEVSL